MARTALALRDQAFEILAQDLGPVQPAPARAAVAGLFREYNPFQKPTGRRARLHQGAPLPNAAAGHTWALDRRA